MKSTVSSAKKLAFQQKLLAWYPKGRRTFSWRNGKRNAYQILIAEIMLRKTDTLKVSRVYDSFLAKYSDPQSLMKAKESAVLKKIRLLGIADRARLLKLLARDLIERHSGRVPRDFDALVRLPGVGPYIANAVLCFAYRQDVPLVDTNVIRLLDRVFSVRSSTPRARNDLRLWEFAASLVPGKKATSYNRALLDHAALLCTYREPRCEACPLNAVCDFYAARCSEL